MVSVPIIAPTSDGAYTWYNYAGFSLQSEEDAAAARYFTHDMLGSTRGVWGPNKAALGTLEYTPYGEVYSQTLPSDVVQRFTFHPLDADSGLHYAHFRHYDPTTARWLSRDPLGMIAGPNMYAYVKNAPVTYYDPFGASPWSWLVDKIRDLISMLGRKGKNGGTQAEELNDHFVSPTVKSGQDAVGLQESDKNGSYPGLPVLPAATPMVMPVSPKNVVNDWEKNVAPAVENWRRRDDEAFDSQNWPNGVPPAECDGF